MIGHVHGRKNTRLHPSRVRPSHRPARRGRGLHHRLCRADAGQQ
ncbi:hypothetical protein NY08_1291 [Rhodococcus sp. B7740]|nr:hypothetical protein NY08_1291 [Rhodococcus sp. B7740]